MASEPRDTPDTPDPDDFDEVLRAVARPPDMAAKVAAQVVLPSTLDMPSIKGSLVDAAPEPAPGDVLDARYRLDRVLGRGGMGVVYAAKNLRTGKVVAIKWMAVGRRASAQLTANMAERFRREARAAASIRHPNVVDVYDVGGPDEAPFLVMELLEGEALSTRIARGALGLDEAAQLMLGVMRGVSAAHRAGIVHRDLKPDNIFLCSQPDGAPPIPKVLDFGVATFRDDSADGLASLTRSGAIVGTPAYMALEQLTAQGVDVRTDVYALGVVLYEALTGRLPFEAKSAGELAVMQATGAPAAVSMHRPGLGAGVELLLKRALARRPSDRHASVDELALALERLRLDDGELRTRPAARPATRTRLVALAGAALLALVSAGVYLALRDARPGSSQLQRTPKRPSAVNARTEEPVATEEPGAAPADGPTKVIVDRAPEHDTKAPALEGARSTSERKRAAEKAVLQKARPERATQPARTDVPSAPPPRSPAAIRLQYDDF